jgi:prepilin-type processing-associated H-X9-DG protein/prepilin-type N-terminal cleavage/methylation domain-containing protein
MRPDSKRTSAFTLVELLVVIGIIAVLIGILLPTLANARAAANSTACLAQLRQMGQAIQMYGVANKGSLPYGYWSGAGTPGGAADYSKSTEWTILLLHTLATRQHGSNYTEEAGKFGGVKELFRDKDTIEGTGVTHYSAHPRLMPDLADFDFALAVQTPPQFVYLKPYKIARIKRAADIVLIMDGTQIRTFNGSNDPNLWGAFSTAYKLDNQARYQGPSGGGRSYLLSDYPGATDDVGVDPGPNSEAGGVTQGNTGADGNIRWRHMKNKAANFLFCDGHAGSRFIKRASTATTPGLCDLKRANINVNRQ